MKLIATLTAAAMVCTQVAQAAPVPSQTTDKALGLYGIPNDVLNDPDFKDIVLEDYAKFKAYHLSAKSDHTHHGKPEDVKHVPHGRFKVSPSESQAYLDKIRQKIPPSDLKPWDRRPITLL